MDKISGLILTKNNERTIIDCVRSILPCVSELIIIDDFSDDRTREMIKEEYPGVKIVQKKLESFDEQRNFAITLAASDWILMIDSDEMISPELAAAIKREPAAGDIDAYWAVRLNRFFSIYLKENHTERPIIFRKKLKFSYPVHETIILEKDRLKKLPGNLRHENWLSISRNMEKMNRYSSLIAKKWLEQNRNYSDPELWLLAIILPVRYFFICFFQKKFYKAGFFNGLFYSLFESSWWLAAIFKYRELKAGQNKKII